MKRLVKGIDRKAIRDRASREILRDPSLTWFVAYAVSVGLIILALLT